VIPQFRKLKTHLIYFKLVLSNGVFGKRDVSPDSFRVVYLAGTEIFVRTSHRLSLSFNRFTAHVPSILLD
jgi:hypothetical protein